MSTAYQPLQPNPSGSFLRLPPSQQITTCLYQVISCLHIHIRTQTSDHSCIFRRSLIESRHPSSYDIIANFPITLRTHHVGRSQPRRTRFPKCDKLFCMASNVLTSGQDLSPMKSPKSSASSTTILVQSHSRYVSCITNTSYSLISVCTGQDYRTQAVWHHVPAYLLNMLTSLDTASVRTVAWSKLATLWMYRVWIQLRSQVAKYADHL